MKKLLLAFSVVFIAARCASTGTPAVAFRNVTVIDATGAPARPGVTVIVKGDRIAAIEAASARPPRNARVIDGTGKFVIPGLWDMHTHLSFYGDEALTMMVRNGVLFVRDLGGLLEQLDGWRAEIDRGTRIGPHIFRAGPYVDGPKVMDAGSPENSKLRELTTITVRTPDEGRAAVDSLKQRGVDTIKTHNTLSRESFLAVAAECRRLGIPLAVHPATPNMTVEEVSDAGATTIEHIEMLTESICYENMPPGGKPKSPLVALDELTDEHAMELFRRFARNGTTYDPTLVGYRTFMQEAVDLAPKDPKYERAAAGRTKMFHRFVALVGLMKRAGVTVVTGTDCGIRPETVPWPVPVPGSDLHDEMKLFVEGGFTPMEALQSATSLPAHVLRVEKQFGTIEPGKEADFLLLDADPLADITNTRKIAAVVLRGVVIDRAQLGGLGKKMNAPK